MEWSTSRPVLMEVPISQMCSGVVQPWIEELGYWILNQSDSKVHVFRKRNQET
uniref:Uncharacterized protein n=1 Tax=Arundo donax TaxID=35708 RepID=A0A0A9AU17_ARUDO